MPLETESGLVVSSEKTSKIKKTYSRDTGTKYGRIAGPAHQSNDKTGKSGISGNGQTVCVVPESIPLRSVGPNPRSR